MTGDAPMANAEQAALWQAAGEHRVRNAAQDDGEVRRHNVWFRAATALAPSDRVLDLGCGSGRSTRDAAGVVAHVTAIDLSAPLLERARELSASAGLDNITYLQADAQVHAFPPASFDVAISRGPGGGVHEHRPGAAAGWPSGADDVAVA
jgi:2-polyprenyl-3-methyl-5-hydroxy-6-metoxy-1,4-benzoquinol methylase